MLANHALGWSRRIVFAAAAGMVAALGIAALVQAETVTSVRTLLATGKTVVGEQIVYPHGSAAKITSVVVTMIPGEETGWHTHGVPVFAYVLEGELTVNYGDKGSRVYRAGDALLEAINIRHDGKNTGQMPVRLLVVFMGAEGRQMTVPIAGGR